MCWGRGDRYPKGAHIQIWRLRSCVFDVEAVQESLVSALGWPSLRSDAYGTIEPWQTPYFAAVQEALSHARPRPQVPNWAEVDRALSGAFREIVYEGQPVQAALDRYHRQLHQVQKRLR
jgi:trehalose transport system substrate-binding protein